MPTIHRKNKPGSSGKSKNANFSSEFLSKLTHLSKSARNVLTLESLQDLVLNPDQCHIMATLLILAEIVINFVVIAKVHYTEIDWVKSEIEPIQDSS